MVFGLPYTITIPIDGNRDNLADITAAITKVQLALKGIKTHPEFSKVIYDFLPSNIYEEKVIEELKTISNMLWRKYQDDLISIERLNEYINTICNGNIIHKPKLVLKAEYTIQP